MTRMPIPYTDNRVWSHRGDDQLKLCGNRCYTVLTGALEIMTVVIQALNRIVMCIGPYANK